MKADWLSFKLNKTEVRMLEYGVEKGPGTLFRKGLNLGVFLLTTVLHKP